MIRWEYRFVEVPYAPGVESSELGAFGMEGWEAVGMHVRDDEDPRSAPLHDYMVMVLLKRPRQSSAGFSETELDR